MSLFFSVLCAQCLVGGREGERSVDVGIFLRAYKAQASCFNSVLCPCPSGVSWLPWGCGAENSPVPSPYPLQTLPSACCLVFELGLCCPPTLHHAGSSLVWRRASFSPGGSICSYAYIKICSQELSGGPAPPPNPCLCKGLAACSWGQPGLQPEPGGSRASERELQASLASCVLCTLGRAAALHTHLVSHLEQLWSWMPPSGGEVGLGISLQCFTLQTGWC